MNNFCSISLNCQYLHTHTHRKLQTKYEKKKQTNNQIWIHKKPRAIMDRDNFALNKQTNKIANIKRKQNLDETVPYMCELQNTTSFPFFFLIFFNCYSKKEKFFIIQ